MATADSPSDPERELNLEDGLSELPPSDEICGAPTSDGSPCARAFSHCRRERPEGTRLPTIR